MPESPDTPESPDLPDAPESPSTKPPRMVVPGKGYREVTLSAIVFGLVVGVIMNAAITYSGLKIGFTIVGSAIAAVLGFGVLRGVLRRGSILECNIGQTIASSVNTTNAGVIFTVPVLLLLGYSLDPGSARFWLLTLACMAGAVMGAAFIIPLRKQMIDIDRLRFPSGTAVGAILKSPGAGVKKTIVLLAGIIAAMLIFLPTQLPQFGAPGYGSTNLRLGRQVDQDATDRARAADPGAAPVLTLRVDRDRDGTADLWVTDEAIDVGRVLGLPDSMMLVFAIAPFALGAGYLTGRAGLMVLAGGVLAYLILNPILYRFGFMPATLDAHEVASFGRVNINRPLGIGLLLGGAMMGIVVSMPAIRAALKSLWMSGKTSERADELGLKPVMLAVAGAFVLLFIAADLSSRDPSNAACPVTGETLVLAVGREAPEGFNADTSDRPTVVYGGYTLMVADDDARSTWDSWSDEQRDAALIAIKSRPGFLSGVNPHVRAGLIALIGTLWIWLAGIIIAQCTGMTDWSPVSGIALLTVVLVMFLAGTGNVIAAVLVGATLCCAITMAADMMADLRTGYIVGAKPKRQQIAELATTWIGPVVCMMTILLISTVNMKQYGVPMGVGTPTEAPQAQALQAVINGVQGGDMPYALYGMGALLGAMLGLGAFAGLGVLVGLSMYLPFIYISTYGIGCIANIVIGKIKGRTWAEEWGVPFAAGLIVGEAILSLIVSGFILARG